MKQVPLDGQDLPGDHEQIAVRAYQLWEAAGRPNGEELIHWIKAEKELAAARSLPGNAAHFHRTDPVSE